MEIREDFLWPLGSVPKTNIRHICSLDLGTVYIPVLTRRT